MLTGALLTIPLLVAPAAPPVGPLDADIVDTSAFPAVVIDFTVPPPLRSVTITADMVQLGGASVDSVAPVDPAGIVVSLVIDDGPTVPTELVNDAQGASVELVRNVGAGTKIALATPSGLQTALTSDRDANIARIAGITAGAPDVTPVPALVLDAAERLAESTETDRHLVLVLGSPAAAIDLDALAAVVASAGIEVHVVAPDNVDLGGLPELAAASGGVVPSVPGLLGEMDVATAAIAQRYRVTATVDAAGPQELAVVVDGGRNTATLDLARPPAEESPSTSIEERTTAAAAAPAPAATDAAASPTAVPQPSTPGTTATASSDGGSASAALVIAGVVALLLACVGLWVVARRRADRDDGVDAAVVVATRPVSPVEQVEPVSPVEQVEAVSPVEPVEPAEPAAQDDPAPEAPAEPAPVIPRDDEAESPPARPPRGVAASRPRRSVSTRRTESTVSTAPPDPAPPAEEAADIEPETEWLVSGDLRLRRSTGEVWSGPRAVSLTPAELGVLELLMRSGDSGVTPDAIAEAAGAGLDDEGDAIDPDALLAQVRRKTRIPGRTRRVRKERVMMYFFDEDDAPGH